MRHQLVIAPQDSQLPAKQAAAGEHSHLEGQIRLMSEVVVDDPFAPEFTQRVEVQTQTRSTQQGSRIRVGRRRVKGAPAVIGKIYLHPGVRLAGAHDVTRRQVVELGAAESVDHARGNVQGAQLDGHGGGKVFAVRLFADKKKLGQGIYRGLLRELERVAVVRAEVLFDGARAVVIIRLAAGYLDRQPGYAGIELGHLQVIQRNLRGEIFRGLAQQFRFDLGDIGTRHVDANRLVAEDRARQILGERVIIADNIVTEWCQEKNVGPNRFHHDPVIEHRTRRAQVGGSFKTESLSRLWPDMKASAPAVRNRRRC